MENSLNYIFTFSLCDQGKTKFMIANRCITTTNCGINRQRYQKQSFKKICIKPWNPTLLQIHPPPVMTKTFNNPSNITFTIGGSTPISDR